MSHDETTDTYTQLSLHTFTIPHDSFTAFRLKYTPAHEVGELNKVLYLGATPAAWYGGKQYGLISGSVKRAKKKMKSRYMSSYSVIDRSLRSGVAELPFWSESPNEDVKNADSRTSIVSSSMAPQNEKLQPASAEHNVGDLLPHIKVQEEDDLPEIQRFSPVSSSRLSAETDSISAFNVSNDILFNQALLESDSETNSTISTRLPEPNFTKEITFDEERDVDDEDHLLSAIERPLTHLSSNTRVSKYLKPIIGHHSTKSTKVESEVPHVTFDTNTRVSKGSSMAFVMPEPECAAVQQELDHQYIAAEKSHMKTLKKISGFAQKSGGKARNRGSRVKSKVARRILTKFKPGEIVRMAKMLVQMSWSDQFTSDTHFTEDSAEDIRITHRWKEYYVLLRKADDSSALLILQFYDAKKGKRFDEKPEHKIKLVPGVKVGFFSTCDKSISITSFGDTGARIALLNAKYEQTAFKWLFLLNEILEGLHGCMINVSLPGLRQSISVPLSPSTLKALQPQSTDIEIATLDFGYHVSKPALPSYLRDRIYSKLNHASHFDDEVKAWLCQNPDPWFCFKLYDRLEWTPFDSTIFYVMHQVLHESHTLQLREASRPSLTIEDKEGDTLVRPYPVEGYLGRATNTSGYKVSNFRVFYKISYFFTVDNILFLTKLFEARPPTAPDLDHGSEKGKEYMVPQRFVVDPFEVDENGHIPWLDQPDFGKRDKAVVEELERRIAQIVKAEAMINLLKVVSVEPLSHKKLYSQQIYFHFLLWHASPKVFNDEELLECAFQINLENGSSFVLMASSRSIRDEWVCKLNELVKFHKTLHWQRVAKTTGNRALNMKRLNLNEYVDSNMSNEFHGFETSFATPHPHLFDMSAISMSSSVLMSGYLYQKPKKHSSFSRYYVVLCPGFIILFSIAKRSKATGALKCNACYEHYITIPISEAYIYSGDQTHFDLLDTKFGSQGDVSGHNQLPRIYPDGWKSFEEESQLCFTLWFGQKRKLRHQLEVARNPGALRMIRKLGITGKSMVFMAQSRVMREVWVSRLLLEINRFAGS